jgi:hypothetical protein
MTPTHLVYLFAGGVNKRADGRTQQLLNKIFIFKYQKNNSHNNI